MFVCMRSMWVPVDVSRLKQAIFPVKFLTNHHCRLVKRVELFSRAYRLIATSRASSIQLNGTPDSSVLDERKEEIGFVGIHHVGLICQNLEKSLEFYCGLLGLETCAMRPDKRLRFRGAWLWVGNQMIHLMELPNPDPVTGRPPHGGEDRHICVSIEHPELLKSILETAGIPYTMSKSGRPVIFCRDPDGNALEFQPSYMHATSTDK